MPATHGTYRPSQLKFYAIYKGNLVEDGDYWVPNTLENDWHQKAGPHNCYPVKISSLGIHYTPRLRNQHDYIEHSDGRTYYGSWESECVHAEDVALVLDDSEGSFPTARKPDTEES